MYWPALAQVLHQPLSDIKAMTVDEFDDAVAYLKQIQGGGASGGTR
jgi:hypothetical protein